jgi:phage head maturation protease
MSEIEFRSASLADVDFPNRTVTVIVAPYETPTEIRTPSRSFTEVVSRGAFDGVERRSNIRANRDHSWQSGVAGKVIAAYPERAEGLVVDVKMSEFGIGPETLGMCAEGNLSASAGFLLMRERGRDGPVKPDAETWLEHGKVRRLNHLYLDHVAFVPDPAYPSATVLDVRNEGAPVVAAPMTNLQRLELEQWREQLAELDRRFGVVHTAP